ncbi:1,2-phenylacetyl-CoA epoxidase subunit PaaE [Paraburkholderia hayleyella]|uniref:1,2-phenylacetyl-CoA epoxidase subunit PaaE n=1 Tax=Paraburkholderia hayleyella TaxID=2152889 RepID=UPI001290AF97|nr:1,2-phenylacetyl-CoA epoxidase subunit PaaE [Paraburkholderia hayleyella]
MARPHFNPLRIRDIRIETTDAVSIAFDVPPALRAQYHFTQGQFVTLKTQIGGEEIRRSYSICVGVTDYERDGELRIGIKRMRGGRFSNFAFDTLKPGYTLDVMTPDGRFFTHLNAMQRKQYVAFAGGSGITPVLSIIKTTLEVEPRSTFTLVYGNRSVDVIMFAEALEDLKNRFMSRFVLYHVLSDEAQDVALFNGVLDQRKCADFLTTLIAPDTIDEAFVCGPAPMMDAAEAALKAAGVPANKIHIERFGSPLPQAGAPSLEIDDAMPAAQLEIILDGKKRKLRLPYKGLSVLDAGLHAGLALPYACKGGVCCTCRARVLEGEVRMDKNYTLEEHEIHAGFVLTCQCHPLSERIVVSYDER